MPPTRLIQFREDGCREEKDRKERERERERAREKEKKKFGSTIIGVKYVATVMVVHASSV